MTNRLISVQIQSLEVLSEMTQEVWTAELVSIKLQVNSFVENFPYITLCLWPNVNTGNNMITIAIWCKKPRVNFSKTIKLHESVGLEQFVDFQKLTGVYLQQIKLEIM